MSSTAHFVGEWEQDGILLSLAWPDFGDLATFGRWEKGPASRSAFVLSLEASPEPEGNGPFPDYTPFAMTVCSYLALLFGKRFDFHGLFESIGYFHVPDLSLYATLCNHVLPQNSHHARVDFGLDLNLTEAERIAPLLMDSELEPEFVDTFRAGAKFYLQALQTAEHYPEVAYLHLVTAGEILSAYPSYSLSDLLDAPASEALARIRTELDGDDAIAGLLEGRMRQIKRRFIKTITGLVDPAFFSSSECELQAAQLKENTFEAAIAATYDVRSQHLHTGQPFGSWIAPKYKHNGEMQVGTPLLDNRSLGKALGDAPTYVGLERTIRYCLLRFAKEHGAYVEPSSGNA